MARRAAAVTVLRCWPMPQATSAERVWRRSMGTSATCILYLGMPVPARRRQDWLVSPANGSIVCGQTIMIMDYQKGCPTIPVAATGLALHLLCGSPYVNFRAWEVSTLSPQTKYTLKIMIHSHIWLAKLHSCKHCAKFLGVVYIFLYRLCSSSKFRDTFLYSSRHC